MLCNPSSSYAPLLFQKMLCYTIFFYLSASLEVTHNGTSSLSLPFGENAHPNPESLDHRSLRSIQREYCQGNLNNKHSTHVSFSLRTVAQLSLSTLSYGYLCPSLKEVAPYVSVLVGSLVVDTKPAFGALASLSQWPIPFTLSRCAIDS